MHENNAEDGKGVEWIGIDVLDRPRIIFDFLFSFIFVICYIELLSWGCLVV